MAENRIAAITLVMIVPFSSPGSSYHLVDHRVILVERGNKLQMETKKPRP
jgi:hypothetical protein